MKFWIVDAFASEPFTGNPAAVVMMDEWAEKSWMQNIAMEMNLSETAFVVQTDPQHHEIRWFSPLSEVPLCGHATLASAHVIWSSAEEQQTIPDTLYFDSKEGTLKIFREDQRIALDLPGIKVEALSTPVGLLEALGKTPIFVGQADGSCFVELDSPNAVISLEPDMRWLASLEFNDVIITANGAPGDPFDIISRCFVPKVGFVEDSVTGSAHTKLGPYWERRLKKSQFKAFQASRRGGWIDLECSQDRVILKGSAVTVAQGRLMEASLP